MIRTHLALLTLAVALAMAAMTPQIAAMAWRTIYEGDPTKWVWIEPYTRRDGVKVEGHWRSYRVGRKN